MRRGTSGISCLLAVDKPLGLSSHDVVSHVRRALGERRVGHAGTLDPAASGVLVVGVGNATRLMGLLTLDEKGYEALIAFGSQTDTDDAEGQVIATAPVPPELADPAFAASAVASLVGECDQVPPAFSAISVDGKRSYARARAGEQVELAPRHVTILSAALLGIEGTAAEPVWRCAFRVSKGTYIRALARDLGASLGTAAHLCGLRRTASGSIGLGACVTLERLEAEGPAALKACQLDPARALSLPVRLLDEAEASDVACGRRIEGGLVLDLGGDAGLRPPREQERVSLVRGGRLLGVWSCRRGRLACEANFPQGVSGVRA